jgi:hypothetical protein
MNQGFGGPGGQGWQMNDATAQMGVQFGKSAVAAGQDYVEKNVSRPRRWDNVWKDYRSLIVHPIPPTPTYQNLIRRDQLLRTPQTPSDPFPMEAQDLDEADQEVE